MTSVEMAAVLNSTELGRNYFTFWSFKKVRKSFKILISSFYQLFVMLTKNCSKNGDFGPGLDVPPGKGCERFDTVYRVVGENNKINTPCGLFLGI